MTQQITKSEAFPEIKDYEIQAKVGQGGIAEIFRARQKSLDRPVAIKILFPELTNDPDIVRRFDRESTTIAALNHPNIVHVIDKGIANGRYYFVMEYVDGTSFKEIIHSGDYSTRDKMDIIVMVLKGLDYAHKNGVIHRDIKPANILIDSQGNTLIADFGIAQILKKSDHEMTHSDVVMGTLAYMSPEQRESSTKVDLTTDIYAIGIMLYEILVGKRPMGRFKLPSEINANISKRFDDIISRCLAEDPRERYQSAVELKDDLLNLMSGRGRAATVPKTGIGGAESFIGKCQFLDTIRESKYSSTMLVENKETHERYVIKKNEKSSTGLKEARLLSKLRHKNIIDIFGAGGDLRRLVVMMEYAPGGSLADRMVKTYSCEKALEIVAEAAEGLDFAHKNNIIHGNLRPSNILFTKEDRLKLTDFGLPPHYTMVEKNWYAPPERRAGKQGDIYALGVILYQMLLGKNPAYDRAGKLFFGAMQKSIPAPLQNILNKMLAIRMTARYKGTDEFLYDWEEFRNSIISRQTPLAKESPQNGFWSKKKILPYAISIVALAIIIALVMIFSK
ncbi:MAG: serine/threonine-protein kinase [candidate division Zixibacteria bacterium]|nr:serine/threonine-protein kinase [candidate division Zixibacteria bacterium]